MDSMSISAYRNLKQQSIKQRYNEIYAHELAHKNAAGSLAGPIVIEKDSDGIPIGGHVAIAMPKLDENNPDETINQANTVIEAALAPKDPSAQDFVVAAKAKNIKFEAENLKNKKRLDYYA